MKTIQLTIRALILFSLLAVTACKQTPDSVSTGSATGQPTAETDTAAAPDEAGLVELTQAQYQTVGVKLGTLAQRQMSQLIRVNGSLTVPPGQQVSVSSPYGGIVKSANLLAGTPVRKGQTLAALENPEFIRIQQDYLEAKSQLTYQQQEYDRQRELSRENVGALKNLQQATAQLGTLRARVGGLRQQLALLGLNPDRLTPETITRTVAVRAPIGGTLTQVRVNRGGYVAANDVLFELVNTAGLLAELTVFEGDLVQINTGQRVRLSLVGVPGERTGRIKLINREVSPDRTVTVYAALDSAAPNGLARPGTFVKAVIETGAATQPALPEAAVVQNGNTSQIFVFTGREVHQGELRYQFQAVPVRAGASQNGYRTVTLPPSVPVSASIVLAGAYDILSAGTMGGDGGDDH